MTAEREGIRTRSVVLHLRSGRANPIALEAASRLAHAMRAEFESLFVEDQELLSLAELPFAREISVTGRQSRVLSPALVGREARARSLAVRREIEQFAKGSQIKCRFEAIREAPDAALTIASERASILVLEHPFIGKMRTRPPALSLCVGSVKGCLVIGSRARRSHGPVVIVLDRPEALDRVAELAEHWMAGDTEDVILVLFEPALGQRARLREAAEKMFPADKTVRIQAIATERPEHALADITRSVGAGLVVARHGGHLVPDEVRLAGLVSALECPLLLYRDADPSVAPESMEAPA